MASSFPRSLFLDEEPEEDDLLLRDLVAPLLLLLDDPLDLTEPLLPLRFLLLDRASCDDRVVPRDRTADPDDDRPTVPLDLTVADDPLRSRLPDVLTFVLLLDEDMPLKSEAFLLLSTACRSRSLLTARSRTLLPTAAVAMLLDAVLLLIITPSCASRPATEVRSDLVTLEG